jgi:hypothetical protein
MVERLSDISSKTDKKCITQGPINEILAEIAQLLVVVEKLSFFESAILIFFCFIPMEISQNLHGRMDE